MFRIYLPLVILLVVLSFVFGGLTTWAVMSNLPDSELQTSVEGNSVVLGERYLVKSIKVIEAHVFDIYLKDGKRYLVALDGISDSPSGSKDDVVRELNKRKANSERPVFVPKRWDNDKGRYVGVVYFDKDSNLSISEWLLSNNLSYSR